MRIESQTMREKIPAEDKIFLPLLILVTVAICVTVLFVTGQAGKGSGVEMSAIARHLVMGQGYLSPYLPAEYNMQTTVSPPLYVGLIAAIYSVTGIETFTSRLILQLFNIAIHCATLVVLYHYCRRALSPTTAKTFAVLFCIHPHLIYLPSNIWETSLTTFFLSCILYLATFHLCNFRQTGLISFGLLLGLTSLSNPAWTIAYPFICLIPFVLHTKKVPCKALAKKVTIISLAFAIVVTPWIYRNYKVSDEFIFIRGMTGPEWMKGNNPHAGGGHGEGFVRYYLLSSEEERQKLARMGESTYDAATKAVALNFIRNDPVGFVNLTLQRVLMWWTGDLDATRWYYDQSTTDYFKKSGASHYFILCLILVLAGTLTTAMGIIGLFHAKTAWRQLWGILLYLIVLPIPFYLIIAGFRYQSALMPILLVPASHAVAILALKWKLLGSRAFPQQAST
ncbi:MAG TPA: hypothetical protein VM553_13585 [Dongiaceae bacterium]|nr:hypothetical protein [Dongiaceae bacterium]